MTAIGIAYNRLRSLIATIIFCMKKSWSASKSYTLTYLICQISTTGISFILAFSTSQLINLLSGSKPQTEKHTGLMVLSALILVFIVLRLLFNKASEYVQELHCEILQNMMSDEIMSKTLQVDMSFFDSPKYHDAFANASRDIHITINVVWNVINFTTSLLSLISALIILAQLNVFLGLLIGISLLPSVIMNQKYSRTMYKWSQGHVNNERQANYCYYIATEQLFAQEIRLFNFGNFIRQRYRYIWNEYFTEKRQLIKKGRTIITLLLLLPEICTAILLFFISFQIVEGNRAIGDYTLYSSILMQFSSSVYVTTRTLMTIFNEKMLIENAINFDQLSIISTKQGNKRIKDIVTIEFKDVCFSYPDTTTTVLNNLNFKIVKGEKICIVGTNGAGKSTIIKLLLRFYDVTQGQILINDVDITEYSVDGLRKCFTAFMQQVITYAFTIRDNIRIADIDNDNKNDSHVLEALMKAEAQEIIYSAAKGLDNYLTFYFEEDGIELSGGQKQRISIARTFYRSSSVMLLDEPATSLDPEAEHHIFQRLKSDHSEKIIIFTSHRLSNIYLADRIILIENGNILEEGTHQELMALSSRYAQLFNYQANKYLITEPGYAHDATCL